MHAANPRHCAHARYGFSCNDLDELRRCAEDRCQICRRRGEETSHGHLVIDHDRGIGRWAVRGLLCSHCNTMLDSHDHVLDADAVARYLARPWHRERGIDPEPPEPPVGTLIKLPNRLVMRRAEEGWIYESGPAGYLARVIPKTWDGFCRRYGPNNIDIIEATGYSREAIRQALDPEVRAAVQKAAAERRASRVDR